MIDMKPSWVRVTSGVLHEFLKDIDLIGRVDEDGNFILYGCKTVDEAQFYDGILKYDQSNPVHGFVTIEEVEKYWTEDADMLFTITKGEFELVQSEIQSNG